jgi:hypothetical protein
LKNFIEDFSARKMSKQSDKFATLAGITTFFQERFNDTIFAGVTLTDLRCTTCLRVLGLRSMALSGDRMLLGEWRKGLKSSTPKALSWPSEPLTSWPQVDAIEVGGPLLRTIYLPDKNEVYGIQEPLLWFMSLIAFVLRHLVDAAAYVSQRWAESLKGKIPRPCQRGMCIFNRHDAEPEADIWCLAVTTGGVSELRVARPSHTILVYRKGIVLVPFLGPETCVA